MCVAVESRRAGVAARVGIARANLDIADRVVGIGGRSGREPVLGAGVEVAQHDWWQTGYGVVVVCCAVFCAGLFGDERGEGKVSYAGRSDGVKITGISGRKSALACLSGTTCSKTGGSYPVSLSSVAAMVPTAAPSECPVTVRV